MGVRIFVEELTGLLWTLVKIVWLAVFERLCRCSKPRDVSRDVVLITGAGSGIGRLMAFEFARLGATVVCFDINTSTNEETANNIIAQGGKAFHYRCDVSDYDEVMSVARKVKDEVGVVTILVNNAGIISGLPITELSARQIEKTFKVNCLSCYWTVKAFLPDMIRVKKGAIVTIASLAGLCSLPRLTDYSGSKAAIIALDDALRVELIKQGCPFIKLHLVCPYYISTGMFSGVVTKYNWLSSILTPEYVASEVVAGVRRGDEFIFLPKISKPIILLKSILPHSKFHKLASQLGMNDSMDHFKGR